MQRLPPIRSRNGNDAWELPLRASTAVVLANVLIGDGDLSTCLRADSCLVLWAACRMEAANAAEPRSLDDIEAWLRKRLPDELQWGATVTDDPEEHARDAERWQELYVSSVRVAAVMERAPEEGEFDYLIGLLHAAPEWLGSCGADINLAARRQSCLPRWLVQILRAARRERPRGLAKKLARALADIEGADNGDAEAMLATPDAGFVAAPASSVGFLARLASRMRNVV